MGLIGNREHRDINPWLIAIAVMSSTFMEVLDTTVVNVSLPHIAGSLSASNDEATWTLTSYLVANAIVLPMTGWLAGRFGRKRLLMLSVTGFTVASFLCGLAPTLPFLIVCRVIQGACGGGLQPLSQAILLESFPPEKRGQAMAFWALGIVVAPMLGPVAGGWLTDNYSWRWVFYINVPIGIVALFVIAAVLHIPVKRVHHQIDWLGTALLSAGVTAIILLTTWGGVQYTWGSGTIIALGVGGAVLLVTFCLVETRAVEPVIPLGLFRNRTFSAASGVGFIIGFSMFGAIVYLPLYLQTVHAASPTASGLELLPVVGGMLFTFIVSGRLVTRTGRYKIFPIVGSAVLAGGLVLLSRLGPHTSFESAALYMVVVGLGIGLVMQVLVVAVQNSVPFTQLGTATSTATFFRTIGGVFGVSALSTVFNNRLLTQLRAHASPAQLKLLHGSSIVTNPAQINRLPAPERLLVVGAFSHALQIVFLVAVPFTVLAFLLSWIMKEIPLRTTARVSAPGADAAAPSEPAAGAASSSAKS